MGYWIFSKNRTFSMDLLRYLKCPKCQSNAVGGELWPLCCRLLATVGGATPPSAACGALHGRSHAARRVRSGTVCPIRGLGEPQQASENIQKDILTHCLPMLSEISAGCSQRDRSRPAWPSGAPGVGARPGAPVCVLWPSLWPGWRAWPPHSFRAVSCALAVMLEISAPICAADPVSCFGWRTWPPCRYGADPGCCCPLAAVRGTGAAQRGPVGLSGGRDGPGLLSASSGRLCGPAGGQGRRTASGRSAAPWPF